MMSRYIGKDIKATSRVNGVGNVGFQRNVTILGHHGETSPILPFLAKSFGAPLGLKQLGIENNLKFKIFNSNWE